MKVPDVSWMQHKGSYPEAQEADADCGADFGSKKTVSSCAPTSMDLLDSLRSKDKLNAKQSTPESVITSSHSFQSTPLLLENDSGTSNLNENSFSTMTPQISSLASFSSLSETTSNQSMSSTTNTAKKLKLNFTEGVPTDRTQV